MYYEANNIKCLSNELNIGGDDNPHSKNWYKAYLNAQKDLEPILSCKVNKQVSCKAYLTPERDIQEYVRI